MPGADPVLNKADDPVRGAHDAASDAREDGSSIPDPIVLPGAGGPIGGPVAGDVADVLDQPIVEGTEIARDRSLDEAPERQ